jgi:sigma-B regulation protein RsbU (phosphoserine phosphatase)
MIDRTHPVSRRASANEPIATLKQRSSSHQNCNKHVACEWLDAGGFPLGLFPMATYEMATTDLRAGDVVVFYTDGLTEAENGDGEQFTRERLAQLVAAHKEESANELMEQIYVTAVRFRGSEAFADDLTLIVLKVKGDDG